MQPLATHLISTSPPFAARFTDRFVALAKSCPPGKRLRAVEGLRVVECKREKDVTSITLKIRMESEQVFTARMKHTHAGLAFSLHRDTNQEPMRDITAKSEKYLLGLLCWAESAVANAAPAPSSAVSNAWKKPLVELYTMLTGFSPATARRCLSSGFFTDHEHSSDEARLDALLYELMSEGHLLMFDWKEDDRFTLIETLANRRRRKGSPACHLIDVPCSDHRSHLLLTFLQEQGLCLVSVESGSDSAFVGITACDNLTLVTDLLETRGLRVSLDVELSGGDSESDEPARPA